MNKKIMISLVVITGLFFAGCSKEQKNKDTKKDKYFKPIEINTSDDKPLEFPF